MNKKGEVYRSRRGSPAGQGGQGLPHPVQRIHQQWRVERDWWSAAGGASRRYFALTTGSGLLCVIYRDETAQLWRLAKVYD